MAVVIESSVWEPSHSLFVFIFFSCVFSVLFYPYTSNKPSGIFDHGVSSSFTRFQRNFLLIYSVASVMEGLWSVFGEFEMDRYGVNKEQMLWYLCVGYSAALLFSTFSGMLSDVLGHKKFCLIFCILHLFVGIWKQLSTHPGAWVASICLSLASSVFLFSFEAWAIVEHEKQGHRQDTQSDIYWLMVFVESGSLIGSQVLANWLLGGDVGKRIASPSVAAMFLSMISILYITQGWAETTQASSFAEYRTSFYTYIFGDKKVLLLAWAQASLHISIAVFWILWAPTLVADGREVHLGLIYPCILGSRMLGSTLFPWLNSGPSSFRTEDYLVYAFTVLGLVLSLIAYDYQEIGVLLTLFCLFHACAGLIVPSLARLRTIYVPNELRGGMVSLSQAPANAAILLLLIQFPHLRFMGPKDYLMAMLYHGPISWTWKWFKKPISGPRVYYQNIGNAAIMVIAALGLFVSAGCIYLLKRLGKQPYQNLHKL